MVSEFSYPYDAIGVTNEQWRAFMRAGYSNQIVSGLTCSTSDTTAKVSTGSAIIEGYFYELNESYSTTGTAGTWSIIYLELDPTRTASSSEGKISIGAKHSITSWDNCLTALTTSSISITQIPLYYIDWSQPQAYKIIFDPNNATFTSYMENATLKEYSSIDMYHQRQRVQGYDSSFYTSYISEANTNGTDPFAEIGIYNPDNYTNSIPFHYITPGSIYAISAAYYWRHDYSTTTEKYFQPYINAYWRNNTSQNFSLYLNQTHINSLRAYGEHTLTGVISGDAVYNFYIRYTASTYLSATYTCQAGIMITRLK